MAQAGQRTFILPRISRGRTARQGPGEARPANSIRRTWLARALSYVHWPTPADHRWQERDAMYEAVVVGALLLTAAAPPVPTRTDDVVDTWHGVKVPDPYRWLEKSDSDEVKSWTDQQNAHMRKLLDGVPERQRIADRLWQLYEIGSLGVPVAKGEGKKRRYFFTRRTGKQNQPVLYLREGSLKAAAGGDRALVDVNQLSVDGTRALDWWFPSEDGRYVAYGVSSNGDEESTLQGARGGHRRGPARRHHPHPRLLGGLAARRQGLLLHALPAGGQRATRRGEVPPQRLLPSLGTDPALDPKIFGEGRDLKDSPAVHALARRALAGHRGVAGLGPQRGVPARPAQGGAARAHHRWWRGRPPSTGWPTCSTTASTSCSNEGAPRYRLFAADVRKPARERWKPIIAEGPDTLESVSYVGGGWRPATCATPPRGCGCTTRRASCCARCPCPGWGPPPTCRARRAGASCSSASCPT